MKFFFEILKRVFSYYFSPSTQALNDLISDIGGRPICTTPVIKPVVTSNKSGNGFENLHEVDTDITESEPTEIGDFRKCKVIW